MHVYDLRSCTSELIVVVFHSPVASLASIRRILFEPDMLGGIGDPCS